MMRQGLSTTSMNSNNSSSQQASSSNDESNLLSSLGASLQDQTTYEQNVISTATARLAPTLSSTGFPSLEALSLDVDLQHVRTVLKRTRRQIAKNKDNNNKLYMKEQMLLVYLLQQGDDNHELLPTKEQRAEQERSERLVRSLQQQQDEKMRDDEEEDVKQSVKRKRVPMMKRKRPDERMQEEEDEPPTMEEKEQLLKLRQEHKRRREERRQTRVTSDDDEEEDSSSDDDTSSSEEEREFELDDEPQQGISTAEHEPESSDAQQTAACPLCGEVVSAVASELDSTLSLHLDQCQRQRSSRCRRAATRASSSSLQPPTSSLPIVHHQRKKAKKTKRSKRKKKDSNKTNHAAPRYALGIDDSSHEDYEDRVDDWIEHGLIRMKAMKERDDTEDLPGTEEYNGLWIPAWVNDRLFGYQRAGIQWMWDLHQQEAGGVLGDEMGLGKTVQISSYLGILAASRKLKSVLIVSPATMLRHWLNELAVWAPGLRRVLIHQSAETDLVISNQLLSSLAKWLKQARSERLYEAIDSEDRQTMEAHSFCGTGYAVLTTYENLRRNIDVYELHDWSYVVLDEAQKIRNPDADVTLACKRLRTSHRLAMSGTPIQNDLRELWSLFDFVFPGRLGTLPAFEQEFADPIRRGGYANASPMQVQLAYRCALMLKSLIEPYLLRRRKCEVKEVRAMPGKTEHVLFCRLTPRQRSMYEAYLRSDEVTRVLRGTGQLLAAVTVLRKISNHPDLVCDPHQDSFESFIRDAGTKPFGQATSDDDASDYDDDVYNDETLMDRSGKLEVLSRILPLWHQQGHRVLIFCQWRKMLNIIERFIMMKGWKFGRLDGNTSVAARQRLVDSFNSDDSYFCMLCTTRTGGVGLNLTGANRIILYDPDFNPQTDAQARERAWRFGQQREVAVYRLITAGTIEEKIYQRQIFKTALSNAVLQDPRQRRLFSQRDLKDLFTLKADTGSVGGGADGLTETSEATKGVGVVGHDEATDGAMKDDEDTLRDIMKSKGLAGIFDHGVVEEDSRRKSTTVREMEEQAKRVARDAVKALRRSVTQNDRTTDSRFGSFTSSSVGAVGSGKGQPTAMSSSSLLSSLRQKKEAIQSDVSVPKPDDKDYSKLLSRIEAFVRRRRPTTDELLKEFDKLVPDSDVAIFRRLLKSIASCDNGRWHLIEQR